MKDTIDVIISNILETTDFLVNQSKKEDTGDYSYLVSDIHSEIEAINVKMLAQYGKSPEFSIANFTKELNSVLPDGTRPEELESWTDKIRQLQQSENFTPDISSPLPTAMAGPIDRDFSSLMNFIKGKSALELKQTIKENLYSFRKQDKPNYTSTIEYYNKYKLWGQIYPERGVYELIDNRAHALVEHASDFEWLYDRLCDSRSKKILLNLLDYWLTFDWSKIAEIVDKTFHDYFDLDLLNCDPNEVFVDVGAYIGDTLVDYLNVFGKNCYKKYYCYEIMPSNIKAIEALVAKYDLKNIEVRAKGASERAGFMFTQDEANSSVGQLSQSGNVQISTVTIDEDINEPLTFIKMDIEGAEELALLGCRKKIAESHPKLALSVYHNHKDLWKLARMISEIDPTYRFYLRYYGGNLCPTEYLLYAI